MARRPTKAPKTAEQWLAEYATKPLPRPVWSAMRDAGPRHVDHNRRVWTYYPTRGMLRAETMGLVERHDPNAEGAYQWRRTEAGDTFFPTTGPFPLGYRPNTYEQHVREQEAKAKAAGNPLALADYSDYCAEIARRYDEMPDIDPSEVWRWELLIAHVERFFQRISRDVDVRFVEGQPYDTAEQMREEVKRTGVMEISREGIEHPIFTPEQQLKFRAVHDYVVHILPGDRGPSFTERGEIRGYNLHRKLAPPKSWPALFTEVAAQACYVNARGEFPMQKVSVMPGVDFYDVGQLSGFEVEGKRLRRANPDVRRLARRVASGGV